MTVDVKSDGLPYGTAINTCKARRHRLPARWDYLLLVPPLLLVVTIVWISYTNWLTFNRSAQEMEITNRIIADSSALVQNLTNAETAQRGYLLVGRDSYLSPYDHAADAIPQTLADLAEAVVKQPDQAKRLEALKPVINEKLTELKKTIELRKQNKLSAALSVVENDRGKHLMDDIRRRCSEIQSVANQRQLLQATDLHDRANMLGIAGSIGGTALFILLAGSALKIHFVSRARELQANNLATILSSIGDGVVTTDTRGEISRMNPAAEALTGWREEDARGKPIEEIFSIRSEETGERVDNPVRNVLRDGHTVGLANHTKLIAHDGREVAIADSAAPIRNEEGIHGVVLVFRDVSERRRAEIKLRTNMDQLRRANEDLKQFAYAASHDFQEPLRMVTSYSQILLEKMDGKIDPEAQMCVRYISEGTKRMRELISDLLAFTRLTAEEIESVPVSLDSVLDKVLQNLRIAIEESGAEISRGSLPTVMGHEAHFILLFQNLLSNAIKYRSKRPLKITVNTDSQADCQFSVSDNGIGIPQQHIHGVFGVFKRLHGREIPGTGMGLSICKRLIERYGGKIWADSEVDKGTTFHFTLPCRCAT